MKKSSIVCGLVMSVGLLLTGCNNPFDHMPDLTEEESALIAEYAAGILIKHDKYAGRLASDAEIVAADEREERLKASAEAFAEEEAQKEAEESDDSQNSGSGSSEIAAPADVQLPFEGIAEFCGLDGFRITYNGYSICDSYPEGGGEERVFSMDATGGNRLLVLQFIAENLTDEERELDILSKNIRFKIAVNEENAKSALSTLLLDDLSSYKDVVAPESTTSLVLIREVPSETAASIQTISLSLQNASENTTTLLE